MRSALPLAAITMTVAVLLSGCVPQDPEVIPPPESSTEPIFATDEEALAAATEAYEAYLAMSDLIAQEGGKEPERIAPYVTEEWLEEEIEAAGALEANGQHLEGSTAFDSVTLQRVDQEAEGHVVVVVYVCVDLSNARLMASDGTRAIAVSETTRWPFEVAFETRADRSLVVGGHEEWRSSEYC